MWDGIEEEKSTNMNFLEQAGNIDGEDDLEILDEPPVRKITPMTLPSKGK